MSRMLSKMNLISVVQQLPKDDIEIIQGYVEMIEEENEILDTKINKYIEQSDEWKKLLNKYISQQKEFIKYLEDWYQISEKQYDELTEPVRRSFLRVQIDVIKEVLSKYKEIIGDVEDGK